MSGPLGVLKSIYNFFAGDAIILAGVALAFGAARLLVLFAGGLGAIAAASFVALIVASLVFTLWRETRRRNSASG